MTFNYQVFRTIDGAENNPNNPTWGQAETPLVRIRDVFLDPPSEFGPDLLAPSYEDGIDLPRGITDSNPVGVGTSRLPNPRNISNTIVAQGDRSVVNILNASDWIWQWGQFIDHDFSLEEPTPESEPFLIPVNPIDVATGNPDSLFNPNFPFISFRRNDPAPGTGAGTGVPREQTNALTAYIDGSQVYGSDEERAEFLRTHDGTGKLKTTVGDDGEILLPFNTAGLPNGNPPLVPGGDPQDSEDLFIAGDVRANEQLGLTAVHTLFVREHNYQADRIASEYTPAELEAKAAEFGLLDEHGAPDAGEYIYQSARKIVGAQIQVITYNEFLPLLIGPETLEEYQGYDETVNSTISNEFANAAYRVGHTLLSPEVQRISSDGSSPGPIALRDAFFQPDLVVENGIDEFLKGLASQTAQQVDAFVNDEVRNFLFAEGNGGLDLASVNIQRGREHGLPTYNDAREGLGLERYTSFDQITSDSEIADRFASVYESIDDVDLWIGAIAEDPVNGGLVGELLNTIISDQFGRTRDGDRFFYRNDPLLSDRIDELESTTLADIIRRNSSITDIQDNAFLISDVVLRGGRDADVLVGGIGNDEITGGKGPDRLSGRSGNDLLVGNRGEDTLEGEVGNDVLEGRRANDYLDGGVGQDSLYGGFGNDYLDGGAGQDLLDGDLGRDTLYGGEGRDTLIGGKAKDTLDGGAGDDLLIGGAGADEFVLAAGEGTDTVVDFEVGKDSIRLDDGLTPEQLQITSDGAGNTVVSTADESIAIFLGVDANSIF